MHPASASRVPRCYRRAVTSVHDHVGLIFCGTRRARGWQKALAARGIAARIDETFGEDSEHGAYRVTVPRRDLPAANQLVTAVTRGEVTLPGDGLGWPAIVALLALVALLVGMLGPWR